MREKFNRVWTIFSERLTYRHWVVLAGLVSGILGLLVFAGLSTKENNDNYVPIDTVQVVVAKQDIAPKTIIKESMVELREVPTSMVADDTVKDIGDIVDKPARVEILKDDIISTRKVLTDIKMVGFTGEIPPECRAISIGITDITGVAGFAKAGDYVDIMLIAKGDDKMTGRIILQDVLLLAVNKISADRSGMAKGDGKNAGDNGDKKQDGVNESLAAQEAMTELATATVAVLPEDALKLITEAQEGTLYLSLRPYKPRAKFTTETKHIYYSSTKSYKPATGTTAPPQSQSQSAPASQSVAPSAPANPAPAGRVEVIRANSSTREGK